MPKPTQRTRGRGQPSPTTPEQVGLLTLILSPHLFSFWYRCFSHGPLQGHLLVLVQSFSVGLEPTRRQKPQESIEYKAFSLDTKLFTERLKGSEDSRVSWRKRLEEATPTPRAGEWSKSDSNLGAGTGLLRVGVLGTGAVSAWLAGRVEWEENPADSAPAPARNCLC